MVYRTLRGEEIDTDALPPEHRTVLSEVEVRYKRGEDYPDFFNLVNSQETLRRIGTQPDGQGEYWITPEVADLPIYKILQDLADRAGIKQGYMRPNKTDIVIDTIF